MQLTLLGAPGIRLAEYLFKENTGGNDTQDEEFFHVTVPEHSIQRR
jgi:hypothetical protein